MLDELHDRVGERIATLVRAEAAMVTSGAASALTLGTAAVLTGTDDRRSPTCPTRRDEERSHHPEGAPIRYERAVRNCGVRFVEVETAPISSAP